MFSFSNSPDSLRILLKRVAPIKGTLVTMILAIASSSVALGQESSKPPASDGSTIEDVQAEQALRQVESETKSAYLTGDTAVLDRIWADEFTFTPPNGMVISKADHLALLKSGAIKYESLELEDIDVRVYGGAAVVTGLATVKGKVPGHIINGQDRYLTVYIKRHGRWRQVASQASRIARP